MTSLINWARTEDEETFGELIQTIRSGNCAAFLGTGLSMNANYPNWEELLRRFSGFVSDHSGIVPEETEDYYQWAENCKRALNNDEQYLEFIIEQFGPGADSQDTTHTYEDIDKTPFSAIVTTNYDPCMINASTRNSSRRKLHSYPHLDAGYLHSETVGHIFHIHGIVHPDKPDETARSIIFTKSEYEYAYKEDLELPNFLYQLIQNHNLLFIGFSLQDAYLVDQVRRIWGRRVSQQENLRRIGQRLSERNHYAILPITLEKSEKGIAQGVPTYIKGISEDEWFANYGIRVLRYQEQTNIHKQLIEIVKKMRQLVGQKIEPLPEIQGIESLSEIEI